MKFSGIITNDRSDVHAKGQGQRLEVKVTEVKIPYSHLRTLILVWIDIWWWNYAKSLILLWNSALFFSRSTVKFQGHTAQIIVNFDLNWVFPDCNTSWNSPMALKWCTKLEAAQNRCPIVFRGHLSNCNSSFNSQMAMKWCTKLDILKKRCPIVFWGHPSNFKVTQAEKLTIWIQFE